MNESTRTNLFKAMVDTMWAQGLDGEDIARDLAKALLYVIKEGKGDDKPEVEFLRLANS